MRPYKKRDFPVSNVRRFLEPGPIVLVSSAWKGGMNIMTMGWHTVMELEPSRVGCFITDANHSYEMIRRSGECVDTGLLKKYGLFILEVVKAHVATSPKYPRTIHYRGDGVFMVSGRNISLRKGFKPENL